MKFFRERDALIAQTMAFVQSVTGKKEDAGKPEAGSGQASLGAAKPDGERPDAETAALEAIRTALDIVGPSKDTASRRVPANAPPEDAPPKRMQVTRPIVPSELQKEIQGRIEGFRAHQERFSRERAEYFSATLAKLRASIDEAAPPQVRK